MMTGRSPSESERLATLDSLKVLDTDSELPFDGLAEAAALVCGMPISLITLVAADRQWFKANVGLSGTTETPREVSFCAHAMLHDEVFEVPDATADSRFAANPLVTGEPGIRFYAGAPLRLADGSRVGALCVIGREPGRLTVEQRAILSHLSTAAVQMLENRRTTDALARSEARFRALSASAPLGVFATDADGAFTYTNRRWQDIFGLTQVEALGDGWARTLHPDDRDSLLAEFRRAALGSFELDKEFRIRHDDGAVRHVRAVSRPVVSHSGVVTGRIGSVQDVTREVLQRQALAQLGSELANQHELLRVTLQSIGDAVITTDAAGHVTWLNPAAERMTGWLSIEAAKLPLRQVFHIVEEGTQQPADDPVATCMSSGRVSGLIRQISLISRDGIHRSIEDSAAPILDRQGASIGAVLVFRDVTEQRRLSVEMTYRATHDALTGLINRSEFETRLQRSLEAAREERNGNALMYIDLDQFKLVNDACGHFAGDELLSQVARLLGDVVRANDTLARLGGDEFGVILENCTSDQALRVAQKICERMDVFRFVHGERRFRIGASIGLVSLDERWDDPSAAMQAADVSCHAAKEAGRNRVHVWFDTDKAMQSRRGDMRWATRLTQALDEERFVLYLQRIESLGAPDTGLHAEILIRLQDADGKLIMPNAFLPAAERFHLATRIDRWVLQSTIEALVGMPDLAGVRLLCVNLSGRSIGDRNFHRDAIESFERAGADICRRLCLEVTETAAVTNMADAADFIDQVRALGIRVALDDFGAGASSFTYLKMLSVDFLKIDGQFIKGLSADPLNEAAVRCFVDVARLMRLQTVAECVDDPATLARVQELGIDYAQGFVLHQPRPMHDQIVSRPLFPDRARPDTAI